jgi:hypothetical protein
LKSNKESSILRRWKKGARAQSKGARGHLACWEEQDHDDWFECLGPGKKGMVWEQASHDSHTWCMNLYLLLLLLMAMNWTIYVGQREPEYCSMLILILVLLFFYPKCQPISDNCRPIFARRKMGRPAERTPTQTYRRWPREILCPCPNPNEPIHRFRHPNTSAAEDAPNPRADPAATMSGSAEEAATMSLSSGSPKSGKRAVPDRGSMDPEPPHGSGIVDVPYDLQYLYESMRLWYERHTAIDKPGKPIPFPPLYMMLFPRESLLLFALFRWPACAIFLIIQFQVFSRNVGAMIVYILTIWMFGVSIMHTSRISTSIILNFMLILRPTGR